MPRESPGEPGEPLAAFVPSARVAGYRLEGRIGAGGMAVVFRARDEHLGRIVALKMLTPALATDQGFRERFIRESRAAAAVDHPHIIPVYEAGDADGVLYIAMRFVAGGDLRSVVSREGPLPPGRTAAVISPVASALDAAHRARLVHRDVKPANILVDASPGRPEHVYLSDFGLSKGALSSASLTGAGHFLGTPDYSAPEQISGKPADGRTDQYALACVAFTLLTGQVPFMRDEPMAVLYAHLSTPPPSVTSLRPDLPRAVDEVLAKALAKAADSRFSGCNDFADALRASLGLAPYNSAAGDHPRTRTVPAAHQTPAPPAHQTTQTMQPAVIAPRERAAQAMPDVHPKTVPAGTPAAATTAPTVPTRREAPPPTTPRAAGPAASAAPSPAPAVPTAQAAPAASPWMALLTGTGTPPAPPWTAPPGPAAPPMPGMRSRARRGALAAAVLAVAGATAGIIAVTLPNSGGHNPPSGSATKTSTHGQASTGTVTTPATGNLAIKLRTTLTDNGGVTSLAFSPDDKLITTDAFGVTDVWDVASGAMTHLTWSGNNGVDSAAISPDGKTVAAVAHASSSVYLWNGVTHAFITVLTDPGTSRVRSVAFSPDSKTLAVGDDSGTTYLWDVARHVRVATLSPQYPGSILALKVAFSPDGRTLAVANGGGGTYLWNVATRTLTTPILDDPNGGGEESVAFSADGRTLAVADGIGATYLWNAVTKRVIISLPGHQDPADTFMMLAVAFSPDSKVLVSSDFGGNIYVWNATTHHRITTLTDPAHQTVEAVAFSPDGKMLAAADDHGTIFVWNISG